MFGEKPLPDFLIAGAAKSATTGLMRNLRRESGVYIPKREINFFNEHYDKGLDWYRRKFKPSKINGDKTPAYMYYTDRHKAIKEALHDVKIIILLRDPVKRAFSNWMMRKRKNKIRKREELGLSDFSSLVDAYFRNLKDTELIKQQPFDIIHRGLYYYQIMSLLKYIPRDRVFIGITEHLSAEPDRVYKDILRFLGVSSVNAEFRRKKYRKGSYTNEKLSSRDVERLAEYYRESNEELFNYLGYRIEQWI